MQYPQNELERKQMKIILYAYVVGSLMYAQTCTRLEYMLTFNKSGYLEVIDYSDSILLNLLIVESPFLIICSY